MRGPVVGAATLAELVAERSTSERGFVFLTDGERQEDRLSFAGLSARAGAIAAELDRRGLAGERALLLYPPGLDYVAGFFGCMLAPAVAVPTYPPDAARLERSVARLVALVEDARPAVALTVAAVRSAMAPLIAMAPALARLEWIATDELGADAARPIPDVDPGSLAFLQYTSGSTGAPKGVELTHRNLLHNSARIHAAFGHEPDTRGVIWLPPYHDMGLIGGILQPLYGGFDVVLMSPLHFLARPMRWLEAISRTGGTASGGPDFAYDLCVRKSSPEERARLDLSSWRIAFDGAEPVRAATLARFADAFAPAGFSPEAFFPCYGLAESTLLAAGGPRGVRPRVLRLRRDRLALGHADPAGPGDDAAVELVGSGRPFDDGPLVIADPVRLTRMPDGEVGEIWLAGPSVARGYRGKPDETERLFGAHLTDGTGPFLRTGDLGFLRGGELYVAGRLKDLVIVRGRNHHPTDLERTAERAAPSIRPGCSAAFQLGVDDPRVVLVAELSRGAGPGASTDDIARAIRQAIAEQHELALHAVVLVRPGAVPKTSSGKIERYACREALAAGRLGEVARVELAAEPELGAPVAGDSGGALAGRVARLLGVPVAEVAADRPLTSLGLDSLMAIELQTVLEREHGAAVSAVDLLRGATLADLEARLAGASAPRVAAPPSSDAGPDGAVAEPDEVPLSVGQRALWFLQQVAPDSAAYNLWVAARVRGALDPDALAARCQRVVDRHPALRAAVFLRDGAPWQRTAPGPLDLEVIDATRLAEDELREAMTAEAHRPFDLSRGVLRVRLYRRADGGALLVAVHHVAMDLWSAGLLFAELVAGDAASGAASGRDLVTARPDVDPLETDADAAYWRDRLAGAPPALELPLDHPRPRRQSFRGTSHGLAIDGATTARLRRLAREEDATLYAVLLAGVAALLHRVTGQDDLVIGSPVARRPPGSEGVVGYLVNPVAIRIDAGGEPSFRALVRRVRDRVLEAMEHAATPFATLVERLAGARPLDRAPLFQSLFALERAHTAPALSPFLFGDGARVPHERGAEVALSGLGASLEPMSLESRASAFDTAVVVVDHGDALRGTWQVDAALFDPASAARWAAQLEILLGHLAGDPDLSIDRAPLAPGDQARRPLDEWNRPERPADGEPLFDALIDESIRRCPDAAAVVLGGASISYAELDRRAARLARALVRLGAGPERAVAVLVERSIEWPVAVLGVLRAGAAYLPVEPGLPGARVRLLLDDAGAIAVVTTRGLADRPELGALPRVLVDDAAAADGEEVEAAADLDRGAAPARRLADQTAYIIYTSGSTGRPKGVAVSHRSACNLAAAQRATFAVGPADRVLQYASCAFDASFFELSLALSAGAALHIVPAAAVLPGPALVELLRAGGVTTVTFPPAVLAALPSDQLPAIRTVIAAGEACPPSVVAAWAPTRRFVNAYGPTEATVWATAAQLGPRDAPVPEGRQPIGRPVEDTRAYVLDRWHRLAPVGAVGELHLGGAGVARGYLGRPGLTAERFLPDPFGPPGARLYRTGDLARWLDDGAIDVLGRADDQIKIRGLRVEPGEIEAALRVHEDVEDVAVVARADLGEPRLVAYLVMRPGRGDPPPLERARAFLRERGLPDHLLPAAVVGIATLPRTPSGKLDRRALPAPVEPRRAAAPVRPSGPMEELLLGVFREVLGHEQIGAEDHFFEVLGGSSMAVVRACALVGERAGLDVPVTAVFEHPTVRELAAHLSGRTAPAVSAAAPSHQDRARARADLLRRRR